MINNIFHYDEEDIKKKSKLDNKMKNPKIFEIDSDKKICVVGDIHGEFYKFLELYHKLPNHNFILVGDIIDRGDFSKEILNFVIENKNKNIFMVIGNHENELLNIYTKMERGEEVEKEYRRWIEIFKGDAFLKSFNKSYLDETFKKYIDFLKELPHIIKVNLINDKYEREIYISHSSLNIPLYKVDKYEVLKYNPCFKEVIWNRDHFNRLENNWSINIFGHSPVLKKELKINNSCICVDNGACGDHGLYNNGKYKKVENYLVGFTLPEENFIFV